MSLVKRILAVTPEEIADAEAELRARNAQAPSDREVLETFLSNCTTLDGKPLTLDIHGSIIVAPVH